MIGVAAKAYKTRQRCVGIIAVEYALVLVVLITFLSIATELYRVSLMEQTLARATHLGALAAGRDPTACEAAARQAFAGDRVAAWLFDTDDPDETIGFVSGTNPDGTTNQEVAIEVMADNGSLADGVDFNVANCGAPGSWIQVRATVRVRPRFELGGTILLRYDSWTTNQL